MKNILIYFFGSILVLIVICYSFFNTHQYLHRAALNRREERLLYLNNLPRSYIFEGVYSSEYQHASYKTTKDRFGEFVTNRGNDYTREVEVSFKSNRIIFVCNGVREEIQLGGPIINTNVIYDNRVALYQFPVTKWEAFYDLSGVCFFYYDTKSKYENYIENDSIRRSYHPYDLFDDRPYINLAVKTDQFGNNKESSSISIYNSRSWVESVDLLNGFISTQGEEEVTLNNIKYLYSNSIPSFVNKAEYSPNEYNLNKYLFNVTDFDRKNPFIDRQIK